MDDTSKRIKLSPEAADEALQQAVKAINDGEHFFDVTIICTTDDYQAAYWMDLLSQSSKSMVLAVSEDWSSSGGAGNGLGTLYAWQKACALAKSKFDTDLAAGLRDGSLSTSLYHTAGKGTRMAPLPASESNNKPGVKLPFPLKLPDGSVRPITVLECVLRQTGIYARKGRLSVFWGDQVFLPTAPFHVEPTHHADILCTLLGDTAPTAEEWKAQGLDKYGVIAVLGQENGKVEAAQVEKVSQETAVQMLSGIPGSLKQVGPSLGSFSVSAAILEALQAEFAPELSAKTGKLDTDPHFWMPLTLPLDSYIQLMDQKGTSAEESTQHYERMSKMKAAFLEKTASDGLGLFGAVDVGKGACWWDYGQLKLYSKNASLLLAPESDPSASLLRQFLGLGEDKALGSICASGSEVDDQSYIIASKLGATSKVTSSLIAGVVCPNLECDGAIVVNCTAKSIKAGNGAILYNLMSEGDIVADAGHVEVGLAEIKDGDVNFDSVLKSRLDIDGGDAWKMKLDMNDLSFEDVHTKNKNADITIIASKRKEMADKLAASLGL
ncbi:hypothetical protein FisN_11Hh161 [Fistulifera solaris]|uniref:Uncharacterized protein n=1 Tax=Fistulifera solaris TaxID=1519565 RepID=A0A1Z5JKU2_FISSO|nr:hypothetical protein FisN_11Hh161 [Fistulifera solaris]|eukprot:GAX14381.1 hypothetical protein FisN_11Hh161 [Fistulifera solaris]